nr:hypothetical protein [Tanacetum cinerariifolium]
DLTAAVQNALQAMLPQIREEICEEFRTGFGSSNAGGNPPPVTIHTAGALEEGVPFHTSDKFRD